MPRQESRRKIVKVLSGQGIPPSSLAERLASGSPFVWRRLLNAEVAQEGAQTGARPKSSNSDTGPSKRHDRLIGGAWLKEALCVDKAMNRTTCTGQLAERNGTEK